MDDPRLASLLGFVASAIVGNGVLYLALGAAVHHAYYDRRRDRASEWRLQPDRPMPTWAEIRSRVPALLPNIVLFNGVVGAALWAIANGHSQVVFDTRRWGVVALVLTAPIPVIAFHVLAFVVHRAYHTPSLFRLVHSVHHRERTPCFVDALAMHPFEAVTSAVVLVSPAFFLPQHILTFVAYFSFVGIHEFLDHTGVRMKFWFLSPSAQHDEHHRSVKRCYGQALTWIDDWLGTGIPRA